METTRADTESSDYVTFAEAIVRDGIIADPWIDGAPRFRAEPVVVTEHELAEMYAVAEAVARVYDEVTQLAWTDPTIESEVLKLTPCQSLMALASQRKWHGLARADVFRTTAGGLVVCELNSDTPTGEPEAVVLGALGLATARDASLRCPNRDLEERFGRLVETTFDGLSETSGRALPRTVGILYPTEMTEDLSLIRLVRAWLEARGFQVVLGSPFNLAAPAEEGGALRLLGVPCPVIVRHYKTDWWGERLPVFRDAEGFDDPLPLAVPLALLLDAVARGSVAVINPFGSVLTQNKRSMALMWEQKERFSALSQRAIEAHIPFTVRLEAMHIEQLAHERDDWVLKSDYGCEGDEVLIGRDTPQEAWEAALALAVPERWVVQRRFDVAIDSEAKMPINYGVFVVAGRASGLYARLQNGVTTPEALSAPVLVRGRLRDGEASS